MIDRQDQLEAELLAMRGRMRRLTATNVVLAVVVLAFGGAGAAYAVAAANSVNSASIIDGSILYADLKDASLGGKKILDNSVIGSKLANNSVSNRTIQDNAVTSTEIANGTTQLADLDSDSVNGAKIVDNSVAVADLNLNGLTYTRDSPSTSVPANQTAFATALCDAGDIAISGGWQQNAGSIQDFRVHGSSSNGGLGWVVTAFNAGANTMSFIAKAVCVEG